MPWVDRDHYMQATGRDPLEDGAAQKPLEVDVNKERHKTETPSESLEKNAAAGIAKSYSSDPLALWGLGVGIFDYATDRFFNADTDAEKEGFVGALYQKGGIENIQKHLQEKFNTIRTENPDLTPQQAKDKLEEYRISDDFFQFNLKHMTPSMARSLSVADKVNKSVGMEKNPFNETTLDTIEQIGASVLAPNPLGNIGKFAGRAVSRAVNRFGQGAVEKAIGALDAIVLPGTRVSNYGPVPIAAGIGVGSGIDQAVRYASGDPNVVTGDAFWDKGVNPNEPPKTSEEVTGVAALGALGALGLGARGAARHFQPSINPIPRDPAGNLTPEFTDPNTGQVVVGPSIVEQAQEASDRAWNNPQHPQGFVQQTQEAIGDIADAVSTTVNRDAPLEQLARDLGGPDLEWAVKADLGLYVSPRARTQAIDHYHITGILPDGTQGAVRPKDIYETAKTAPQESTNRFFQGNLAQSELYARQDVLDLSVERYRATQNDPQSPEHVENMRRMHLLMQDDPTTRPGMTHIPTPELRRMVQEMQSDPIARGLNDNLALANTDVINFSRRVGLISPEEATRRLQRADSSPIFENQAGGMWGWLKNISNTGQLDIGAGRNVNFEFSQPGQVDTRLAVNNSIDPLQGFAARTGFTISEGKRLIGERRILNDLVAHDPQGNNVSYKGPATTNPPTGFSVVRPVNGVDHVWQFRDRAHAEAFDSSAATLGIGLSIFNGMRKLWQFGTTGPLAPGATKTAFASLGFDTLQGVTSRPAGTSFGLIGSWSRRVTANPRQLRAAIDIIESPDVITNIAQTGAAIVQMPVWKAWGMMGQRLMDMSVQHSPLMRAIEQLPGGRDWVRRLGADMWRAYEATPIGILREHGAYQPSALLADSWSMRVNYDQSMKSMEKSLSASNLGLNLAKSTYRTWKSALDIIHNAPKVSFFAQNYAIKEAQYGVGNVPEREMRILIEQTRRLGGDMQGIPGDVPVALPPKLAQAINKKEVNLSGRFISAVWPYANQSMQASRYLYQQMFTQGTYQSAVVAARVGSVIGLTYTGLKMSEEMGLNDWLYEGQNDWERLGTVILPTPKSLNHFIMNGGQWPKVDPKTMDPKDYIHIFRMTPEIAPLIEMAKVGFERFGLINRGRNLGETTADQDMRKVLMNQFNFSNIPALDTMLALSGDQSKINFMAGMEGRSVVQRPTVPRNQGVLQGELPSGIPVFAQTIASTLFGTSGLMIVNSGDAFIQKQRAGDTFGEALGEVLKDEILEGHYKKNLPTVPNLWKADEKHYVTSPIAVRLQKHETHMRLLNEQWKLEFSPRGAAAGGANRPRIQDRQLKMALYEAHKWFETGGYPKLQQQLNMTRNKIDQLNSEKGRMSVEQREQRKAVLVKQLRAQQERMATFAERYDERLGRKLGPMFESAGVQPNLEGLIQLLQGNVKRP